MVMEVEVKGVRQVSKEGEEGKEREEGPTPRVMEELRVDHTGEKRRRDEEGVFEHPIYSGVGVV